MAIWIQISPGSNEPIYLQIAEQIRQAIARGSLSVGEKLPAVRKLAAELVINPNTVARAYTVLEKSGLLATKTGAGTFVSDPKMRQAEAADINILSERIDMLITRALNLGISSENLKDMFEQRLNDFLKKS